jgi:hypothetical protein
MRAFRQEQAQLACARFLAVSAARNDTPYRVGSRTRFGAKLLEFRRLTEEIQSAVRQNAIPILSTEKSSPRDADEHLANKAHRSPIPRDAR